MKKSNTGNIVLDLSRSIENTSLGFFKTMMAQRLDPTTKVVFKQTTVHKKKIIPAKKK